MEAYMDQGYGRGSVVYVQDGKVCRLESTPLQEEFSADVLVVLAALLLTAIALGFAAGSYL